MKLTAGVVWLMVFSKPKKKKILFLMTGPPMLPPKSLKCCGVLKETPLNPNGAAFRAVFLK